MIILVNMPYIKTLVTTCLLKTAQSQLKIRIHYIIQKIITIEI